MPDINYPRWLHRWPSPSAGHTYHQHMLDAGIHRARLSLWERMPCDSAWNLDGRTGHPVGTIIVLIKLTHGRHADCLSQGVQGIDLSPWKPSKDYEWEGERGNHFSRNLKLTVGAA